MDSMDLEKEKGITIRAKNAAFKYKDYHINIVDTPGHADFGGEVERIMNMIDGVLLVVDAAEGSAGADALRPPQGARSRRQAHRRHQQDRPRECEPEKSARRRFSSFFISLNATDEQLDFPFVYCSAKAGYAKLDLLRITIHAAHSEHRHYRAR